MTPAVKAAQQAGIPFRLHEYQHDPHNRDFGLEAAHKLGLSPAQVFKTLMVSLDADPRTLAVAVVPVDSMLDLKAMARACRAKKAHMADPAMAERITGYVVGGISPLGQKRRLPTVIDSSAGEFAQIFVSAGRRGMDIELAAADLCTLLGGSFAPIARDA
jgi:Cys-tRNA(Pro)/Cys-tRNA(Cys) deacylase